MKKSFLSLNNFIALLGILALLLFLTPGFRFFAEGQEVAGANLFTATFGGAITMPAEWYPRSLVACSGLIAAFVLLIVGIVFSLGRNFKKFASYLALPCYLAAGILVCLSQGLVTSANINASWGIGSAIYINGWPIAIGVIICVAALFSLIDGVIMTAKPKVKEVY